MRNIESFVSILSHPFVQKSLVHLKFQNELQSDCLQILSAWTQCKLLETIEYKYISEFNEDEKKEKIIKEQIRNNLENITNIIDMFDIFAYIEYQNIC